MKTITLILGGVALALAGSSASAGHSNCTGTYPSYFQDPEFTQEGMWDNQAIINQPPSDWKGPVFRLSDDYGSAKPEGNYPWEAFNPFDPALDPAAREQQARAYIDAVIHYIQQGNIDSGDVSADWTLCNNQVRPWFHIPYQTYDPMSGREFVHGLTREAPVTMTLNDKYQLMTTMWAVGFFNPAAGNSLSRIWTGKPDPEIPTENFHFNDGSVIGKLLFTTANPTQFPFLTNMPVWQANISAPEFCSCTPSNGESKCSYKRETEQCPRTVADVYLLQFDVAVRDPRSPVGWAYGTFVADGQRKAAEKNPWKRISPLGLMWGNDTPPLGTGAAYFPKDPRTQGLKEGVIFWDVVDMLNGYTNAGHLGCNRRLNGPADNAQSSCLSCHQTASVPDQDNTTPAIMFQFSGMDRNSGQCMTDPSAKDLAIDQVYFKSQQCSESFAGPPDIVAQPNYASGAKDWISLDFSLQVSISITQWQEWQQDRASRANHVLRQQFDGVLPSR